MKRHIATAIDQFLERTGAMEDECRKAIEVAMGKHDAKYVMGADFEASLTRHVDDVAKQLTQEMAQWSAGMEQELRKTAELRKENQAAIYDCMEKLEKEKLHEEAVLHDMEERLGNALKVCASQADARPAAMQEQ